MHLHDFELDRLLELARDLLGANDVCLLARANLAVNKALTLDPDRAEAWLLKCQLASALGDDEVALVAAEFAHARATCLAQSSYWRGAILGDLGRFVEALRAIDEAFETLTAEDSWLVEDLYYEKVFLLAALGHPGAAAVAYAEGLRACPGSALLHTIPGVVPHPGLPFHMLEASRPSPQDPGF